MGAPKTKKAKKLWRERLSKAQFKTGKPKCPDCNKELKYYIKTKCSNCLRKDRIKKYKKYYCKDCGKKRSAKSTTRCQKCGCSEVECNRKLSVHHIDYDKENNKLENLISLCESCHGKTCGERTYWTKYFKEKIKELIPC